MHKSYLFLFIWFFYQSAFGQEAIHSNASPAPRTITSGYLTRLPSRPVDLTKYRASQEVLMHYAATLRANSENLSLYREALENPLGHGDNRAPDCSNIELVALRRYVRTTYNDVNSPLWKKGLRPEGTEISNELETEILALASAINCMPQFHGTVVRGTAVVGDVDSYRDRYPQGGVVVEYGFDSTSTGRDAKDVLERYQGHVRFVFHVTHGAYLPGPGSNIDSEREVLLPAGKRFRVNTTEIKSLPYLGGAPQPTLVIELEEIE